MVVTRKPAVSIIIPSFNRKDLLVEAVESCLNQTWSDFEIVIVDDGSTDGTDMMVAGMQASSWPRDQVFYFKQTNRGAAAARNLGLRLTNSRYVQFLDSDDLLASTKIAKQVNLLETPENANASCCYCFGSMGKIREKELDSSSVRIGSGVEDPRELISELCSRRVHGMQTSAPLWRRDFLMQRAGWREDIALGDDLEYHIRMLVDTEKVCFINEELFFVRDHSGSRLSADQMTTSSLASVIRTRHAVFETLRASSLWNMEIQGNFLGAMRTIYANALQLDDQIIIRGLEKWLKELAISPKLNYQVLLLIMLRHALGRRIVLIAHKRLKKLRLI